MKLITLLVIFTLFYVSLIYSQENYSKGYYVTEANDTISGYIKYQPYYHYRKDFYFKKERKGEDYSIKNVNSDIRLFYLESSNQYYKNQIITIHSKPDINTESSTEKVITDTVFVKILVVGDVNLYVYRDYSGRQNFYIKRDSSIISELYIKQYYHEILDNGNPVKELITDEVYTDVLRDYFEDCEIVNEYIYKAELTERSLIRLVSMYNNCSTITSGSDYISRLEPDYKIHYSVCSGMGISRWIFSGTEPVFNDDSKNYFHSIGADINISFPKINNNLSFGTGFSFQKNKFKNEVVFDKNIFVENQKVFIGSEFINVPIYIKYSMPFEQLNLNISGGIFMSFLFSSVNDMEITRIYSDGSVELIEKLAISRERNFETFSALKEYESGLFVGLGTDYELSNKHILHFNLKAFRGGSVSLTSSVTTESYTYLFMVGYSL